MIIVSIDPGCDHCGVAIWEGGELRRALYVASNTKHDSSDVNAWNDMAMEVWLAVSHYDPGDGKYLVIEVPQVYQGHAQGIDLNDLVNLAGVVGAITAKLRPTGATGWRPREWKGGIKKEKHHPRILAKLSDDEQARIELTKNKKKNLDILDAIGIGLKYLQKKGVR